MAVLAFTNAIIEPIDRSMPPLVMTNVIAIATIMSGADCLKTLSRFPAVRKTLLVMVKMMQQAQQEAAMESTWAFRVNQSTSGEYRGRSE